MNAYQKKYYLICLIALAYISISQPPLTFAQIQCETFVKDIPQGQTTASASTFSNLRNAKGSLRYESDALLKQAVKALKSAVKPSELCPAHCQPGTPEILFSSVPKSFLSEYSDQPKCNRYYQQTQKKPLKFPTRKFDSIDSLSSWFGDFSQGKGTDGNDLYNKCDGSCSPQYKTVIQTQDSQIIALPEAICGPARDKDENMYILSYAIRWRCQE